MGVRTVCFVIRHGGAPFPVRGGLHDSGSSMFAALGRPVIVCVRVPRKVNPSVKVKKVNKACEAENVSHGQAPLFASFSRLSDLGAASEEDVGFLKRTLSSYEVVMDEDPSELRFCPALDVDETRVCFGLHTSQLPGADFYLTIESDGNVLYSDGMLEYNVPIYPIPSSIS